MAVTFSLSPISSSASTITCRDKDPWEASDGAVYMLRELAAVAPAAVPEFLPALAELARMQHFAHVANLHETIWKQLPAIAEGIGKKVSAVGGWQRFGGG